MTNLYVKQTLHGFQQTDAKGKIIGVLFTRFNDLLKTTTTQTKKEGDVVHVYLFNTVARTHSVSAIRRRILKGRGR